LYVKKKKTKIWFFFRPSGGEPYRKLLLLLNGERSPKLFGEMFTVVAQRLLISFPIQPVKRLLPHLLKFRTGFIQNSALSSWGLDKNGDPPRIVENARESNSSK
jgi:hypothetical protein